MKACILLVLLAGCAPCPPPAWTSDCDREMMSVQAALTRVGPCDVPSVCPDPIVNVDACVYGIDVSLTCPKLQHAAMQCGLVP